MSGDYPIALHRVTLTLCDLCIDGKGGECHVPGCSLYLNRAPDLSIRERCEHARDYEVAYMRDDSALIYHAPVAEGHPIVIDHLGHRWNHSKNDDDVLDGVWS